jgi:hypothetical protein
MANPNSDLVLAGTGADGANGLELLWVAPIGTTAPTNAYTPLTVVSPSWEGMGYVSSDGATRGVDESNNEIAAFGTGVPVRTVNPSSKHTLQVVCLETNATVLEVFHRLELGSIVPDASGDFSIEEGDVNVQRYSFVLAVVDGDNVIRTYYPSAEVTDRTERKIGNGEAITYGFTITAYPGSTGYASKTYYRIPELASS